MPGDGSAPTIAHSRGVSSATFRALEYVEGWSLLGNILRGRIVGYPWKCLPPHRAAKILATSDYPRSTPKGRVIRGEISGKAAAKRITRDWRPSVSDPLKCSLAVGCGSPAIRVQPNSMGARQFLRSQAVNPSKARRVSTIIRPWE